MRQLFLSLLCFITLSLEAQNITNADFNIVENDIEITFLLDKTADIDIFYSINGGRDYLIPEHITGDVGENIMPGKKKAVWHVFADRDALFSNNVLFKIKVRETKETIEVDDLFIEMIKVRGGSFKMGGENSTPVHDVWISDFYLCKTEVSVALFKKFIDATGYKTDADKKGGSYITDGSTWGLKAGVDWRCDEYGKVLAESDYTRSVGHVSWNDAVAFCAWLKQTTGKSFRLPTEAEWEFVARGGDNAGKTAEDEGFETMDSDKSEWCNDIFGDYSKGSQVNPTGKVSGSSRSVRGASDFDPARGSETMRQGKAPHYRCGNIGIRLAL